MYLISMPWVVVRVEPVMWIRIDCIRIRIQVNKITKFLKHFLIFKVKKTFYFQVTLNLLFLGSDLKNKFPAKKKIFLLVKLCFSFILSVILYLWIRIHGPKWIRIRPDPDPDPHHWVELEMMKGGTTQLKNMGSLLLIYVKTINCKDCKQEPGLFDKQNFFLWML